METSTILPEIHIGYTMHPETMELICTFSDVRPNTSISSILNIEGVANRIIGDISKIFRNFQSVNPEIDVSKIKIQFVLEFTYNREIIDRDNSLEKFYIKMDEVTEQIKTEKIINYAIKYNNDWDENEVIIAGMIPTNINESGNILSEIEKECADNDDAQNDLLNSRMIPTDDKKNSLSNEDDNN